MINILGTIAAIIVIDRIGSKPLALIGSVGMAICLGVAACVRHATGSGATAHIPKNDGTVAIVAAHVYVFFFGMSWGVVVWVLLGEMFPNRSGRCAAVAAAAQWLANFAITQSFPSLARWSLGLPTASTPPWHCCPSCSSRAGCRRRGAGSWRT